ARPPVRKAPAEDKIASVDASVDALMRLLNPPAEVVDPEPEPAPVTAEAAPVPAATAAAPTVPVRKRRRRRAAKRTPEADAARDVVGREIMREPEGAEASTRLAEPVIDLTADGPRISEVEIAESQQPAPPRTFDLPARTRAVRIKSVKANGRRRWFVDVLV